MSSSQHGEREWPGRTVASRREIVSWGGKIVGGAALAVALPGGRFAREAAAQDDGVILVAGASEIGAAPGSAFARAAAAEAAASRGAARVQAAAALAGADSGDGAVAHGAAAFAAADPDEGAVAQGALAVATASSQDDDDREIRTPAKVIAPAGRGSGGRRARGGGGGRVGGGRAMRAGRGGGRDRGGRRSQVGELPSSGIGSGESGRVASLFATVSAIAGLGAVMLRGMASAEPVKQPVVIDV